MNENTRTKYCLARMYEYVEDALLICEGVNNNYENVVENRTTKHAINMCLLQIGERAKQIRDTDPELYRNQKMELFRIKGLRDRIAHSYGDIDYAVIKVALRDKLPQLKEMIEKNVHKDILENPYILYEIEYTDYIDKVNVKDNESKDGLIENCMKKTAARFPQIDVDNDKER